MADWNAPVLGTAYATWHSEMQARDVNALTLADTRLAAMTNIPTNAKRWNNTDKVFESYEAGWNDLVLAVTGGGTGATTAAGSRASLGLGTMSIQDANAVAITGGTIVDCTLTATVDDTEYIGSNTFQYAKAYFKSGLKIPVGADAYLVA